MLGKAGSSSGVISEVARVNPAGESVSPCSRLCRAYQTSRTLEKSQGLIALRHGSIYYLSGGETVCSGKQLRQPAIAWQHIVVKHICKLQPGFVRKGALFLHCSKVE